MQQCFRLLIFLNEPYMFRATNSPILRNTFFNCMYSFWYNAPTLLPTGATVEMELCIQYIQSKVLLRMGEFVARNMFG